MKRKLFIFIPLLAVAVLWLCCLPRKIFGNTPYSTVVTASGGELLGARIASDGQWRFPPADSLPEKFAIAVVEYEDRTFYFHFGVSVRGIGRALWQNITNGRIVSGGSTISMQTVRLHRRGDRTVAEKIIEMFMATRLESRYSKAEILRMYASHAPFGGNVVGIEAAMWRYLGSNSVEMSWAEAATLAVLQNAPSAMHLAKNRHLLQTKRNRLLGRLHDRGVLTAQEYALALDEPLIGAPRPMPQWAPHYVEQMHRTHRGMRTSTGIVFAWQRRLESTTSRWKRQLALSGINDLAAVVVDVATGQVVAYCGNADMESARHGMWVDVARARRSSGSILKPLLYCAAIQEGLILPHTILPDIPTDFGGFEPKNFDGAYSGVVDAQSALALSLNIPNVWLLKEYGVARFAKLLKECGVGLAKPSRQYGLSLVLGGAEVSLVDITQCYASVVGFRGGRLNDSTAVYAMLEAMKSVERPDGLDCSRAASVDAVAWKTGTSYGSRDGWAVGITPGYVVGVWVGNADGSGVAGLTGARSAGPVMFDIINMLPSSSWFAEPQGHTERVCVHSGHRAGKYCSHTRLEMIGSAGLKTRSCPYCREIPVSADGLRRVTNGSEAMEMKSYFLLPPVQKHYYALNHAYTEPSPATVETEADLKLVYPADGAVISLPCRADGHMSQLVCKAAHADISTELFWHFDGRCIGSTRDIHQMAISAKPGVHKITVMDTFGVEKSVEITVK